MTSDLPPTGQSEPPPDPAGPSTPGPSTFGSSTTGSSTAGSSTATDPGPAAGPPPSGHFSGHFSGPATGHGTDEFFDRLRSAGITRPDEGRWVAGVAAAISRRWDVDPILVRGVFVALSIFGGIGVVVYGLAWLLLPQDDGRIHLQQAIRGHFSAGFVGAVLLTLAAIGGGGGPGPWHDGWFGWAFPGGLVLTGLVVFGIWWLAKRRTEDEQLGAAPTTSSWAETGQQAGQQAGRQAAEAGRRAGAQATEASRRAGQQAADAGRRAGEAARLKSQEASAAARARKARTAPSRMIVRLTLGIALLVAAAIVVIGNANDWTTPVGVVAAAAALGVIAAGVIASGLHGRRAAGLAGIGLLLALGTLAAAGAEHAGVRSDQHVALIGERTWQPATADAAERQFNLGVGEATLWLTDPAILGSATAADPLEVTVRVGAGHLVLMVPEDVAARLDLTMGAGQVTRPDGSTIQFDGDRKDGDRQVRLDTGPAGAPLMVVDVQQGAGEIDVRTITDTTATPSAAPSTTPSTTPSPTPTN